MPFLDKNPPLINFFLETAAKRGRPHKLADAATLDKLSGYSPGCKRDFSRIVEIEDGDSSGYYWFNSGGWALLAIGPKHWKPGKPHRLWVLGIPKRSDRPNPDNWTYLERTIPFVDFKPYLTNPEKSRRPEYPTSPEVEAGQYILGVYEEDGSVITAYCVEAVDGFPVRIQEMPEGPVIDSDTFLGICSWEVFDLHQDAAKILFLEGKRQFKSRRAMADAIKALVKPRQTKKLPEDGGPLPEKKPPKIQKPCKVGQFLSGHIEGRPPNSVTLCICRQVDESGMPLVVQAKNRSDQLPASVSKYWLPLDEPAWHPLKYAWEEGGHFAHQMSLSRILGRKVSNKTIKAEHYHPEYSWKKYEDARAKKTADAERSKKRRRTRSDKGKRHNKRAAPETPLQAPPLPNR